MGDWTAEAAQAVSLCQDWAKGVQSAVPIELFLFGSTIYKGGEQFDRCTSDIDIVALFPADTGATDRLDVLKTLRDHKAQLELNIIPRLGRLECIEPAVSVVPITRFELRANIHKSGARHFFDRNRFLNLQSGEESFGLYDAGSISVRDEGRYAIEFTQGLRNQFLAKSANLTGGLTPYDGIDPMPKALLRFAAQIDVVAEGEWYDTRHGLELIFDALRQRRTSSPFKELFDHVSVRRGGRGKRLALSDEEQILLGEVLYDLAVKLDTDALVQWELRVSGGAISALDNARLMEIIHAIAPDATLISTRFGSVIYRFQSSLSRYKAVHLLNSTGLLAHLFREHDTVGGSAEVELRLIQGDRIDTQPAFASDDPEQRIADIISAWKPNAFSEQSPDSEREKELELGMWIERAMLDDEDLTGASVLHEPRLQYGDLIWRPDIMITLPYDGAVKSFIIELIVLRSVSRFFNVLERMLEKPTRVMLVVVGIPERLERIQKDIVRLSKLSDQVRVIPVPLQFL